MSRIGKAPIPLEKGVEIELKPENTLVMRRERREKVFKLPPFLSAKIKDRNLFLIRKGDENKTRSFHGLFRSLIYNAVVGETKNWKKTLQLNGVGYRASVSGKKLILNLGYSHPVELSIPDGLSLQVMKNTSLVIEGRDKELVGNMAARIRSYRPPEPFLGKGVKYETERIVRKAGKSSVKGK